VVGREALRVGRSIFTVLSSVFLAARAAGIIEVGRFFAGASSTLAVFLTLFSATVAALATFSTFFFAVPAEGALETVLFLAGASVSTATFFSFLGLAATFATFSTVSLVFEVLLVVFFAATGLSVFDVFFFSVILFCEFRE
jgi:hypothetical protein